MEVLNKIAAAFEAVFGYLKKFIEEVLAAAGITKDEVSDENA